MKKILFYGILILGLSSVFSVWAKDSLWYPSATSYLNDSAGVINAQDQRVIENLARELDSKTTSQLAVVTVNSTQPETIEQYAVELFKKWGIGQKGKDNGVLFIIAVKDHTARIEVGYGLEGVLTDAISSTIIHQIVIPEFKQAHISTGILEGAKAIVSLIAKENGVTITGQEAEVYREVHQDASGFWVIVFVFVFIFTFYVMSFSLRSPRGWRDRYYGGGWGGGGGGFSGGGGGFGGFGGGGSGGGGASGSW
jgi:uncharacterized protein